MLIMADGPAPVEPVAPDTFGVTLEDVRSAYLPAMGIDDESLPTADAAQIILNDIADQVHLRLGDYTTFGLSDAFVARISAAAARLVRLGTASLIDDAAHPDVATVNGDEYGQRLWLRYKEGLDELVLVVNNATPGDDPAVSSELGEPAVISPPPVFTSQMPF